MDPIRVTFPGGLRVDAQVGEQLVRTDQPIASGGGASAPSPMDLFYASLATCAGYYVAAYCRTRDIPTDGLGLRQSVEKDATGHVTRVAIIIELPAGFPSGHRVGIVRAAAACKVKKLLAAPPTIEVTAEPAADATATA